jgi:hypothetical protein
MAVASNHGGHETVSETAVVHDYELERASDELNALHIAHERLTEQGIDCRVVGVNGRKIDSEYRMEITPPYEVQRDEAQRRWTVRQPRVNPPIPHQENT